MATFNEVGGGGITLSGCVILTFTKTYITAFGPGDIVYSLPKAKRGLLERVVIRRQHVVNPIFVQGAFEVYYEDTLHSLWNESDLTSHQNALDIAKAYYEQLISDAEKIKTC